MSSLAALKNVLISGATGNLGPVVLNEFIASGKFNVHVLARPNSKSAFPPNVKILRSDYTPASLAEVFKGQPIDAVINLVGVKNAELEKAQTSLIDASKAAGVKRFIPADFGNDLTIPEVLDLSPVFAGKARAVEYLQKVQTDSFTWTAFINGAFFDWCLTNGILGIKLKERKLTMFGDGSTPFSTSNLSTVAKALVNLLSDADRLAAAANKRVYIHSYNVTQQELLTALEKVSGEKWDVERLDLAATEKHGREEFAKGNFMAAYELIHVAAFKNRYGDHSAKSSNDLLGLQVEDLETVLKRAIEQSK